MNSPRIVTYAGTIEQVQQALALGADHLILEDPRLGVRSWLGEPRADLDFRALHQLMNAARYQRPDIRLSLNCDALFEDRHHKLLSAAVAAASDGGCDALRFQDPGMIQLLRAEAPSLQAELATEMGNACSASVASYASEGFHYQSLSNDWPQGDVLQLRQALPQLACELLVHGPVLIQYSARRQLSAHQRWAEQGPECREHGEPSDDGSSLPATPLRSVVVDGRPYPFADNNHGNIMYNTFDRCLYPYLDLLHDLQLSGWLIDGRGQDPQYLQQALTAFVQARDQGLRTAQPSTWDALQASAERRLKPGFFLANNTDRCFEDSAEEHESRRVYGEVIDVIRDGPVTMLLCADLPSDPAERQRCFLDTPEGRRCPIDWSALCDLSGQPISQAPAGSILQFPWSKGLIPHSRLVRAGEGGDGLDQRVTIN